MLVEATHLSEFKYYFALHERAFTYFLYHESYLHVLSLSLGFFWVCFVLFYFLWIYTFPKFTFPKISVLTIRTLGTDGYNIKQHFKSLSTHNILYHPKLKSRLRCYTVPKCWWRFNDLYAIGKSLLKFFSGCESRFSVKPHCRSAAAVRHFPALSAAARSVSNLSNVTLQVTKET